MSRNRRVRERTEGDRLIALGDGEASADLGRWGICRVAGLIGVDGAGTDGKERDHATARHRAGGRGGRVGHGQAG